MAGSDSTVRQKDVFKTRLEALRSSLQLTDRVLTKNSKTTLKFVRGDLRSAQCPAMSVGADISIDLEEIPELHTKSGLVHLLGLNYHEVGHVRFGINRRLLYGRVKEARHVRFDEAYEILEEARIETLLAARYEKMKKYFTYPVMEHFVNDRRAWGLAFLYTHGRKYLPRSIRDNFRKIFEDTYGKQNTSDLAAVINQYRLLSFSETANVTTGARLIQRFAQLLEQSGVAGTGPHAKPHEFGGMTADQTSAEESRIAQKQSAEQDEKEKKGKDGSGFREEEESETEEDEEDEEGGGEDDTGDGVDSSEDSEASSGDGETEEGAASEEGESDGGSGGEDNEEEPDWNAPDDWEGSDSEFDGGGDSGSDNQDVSSAAGNAPGDHTGPVDARALKEALEDALSEVLANEHVQTDVAQLQDAMEDQSGLNSTLERHTAPTMVPVTPEMASRSERLAGELRQLWAQMEPGWEYGLPDGSRIDMNRAAVIQDPDDYDSIYVGWNEGQQDNAGLCVVILADESSSMNDSVYGENRTFLGTRASIASKNLWEIQNALREVEATTTVLTFDSYCRTLCDTDETVGLSEYAALYPGGGTQPYSALEEARRILAMSDMPNKLLVTISDGEWGGMGYRDVLDNITDTVKVAILIGGTSFGAADKFDVVARTSGDVFESIAKAVVAITERNISR